MSFPPLNPQHSEKVKTYCPRRTHGETEVQSDSSTRQWGTQGFARQPGSGAQAHLSRHHLPAGQAVVRTWSEPQSRFRVAQQLGYATVLPGSASMLWSWPQAVPTHEGACRSPDAQSRGKSVQQVWAGPGVCISSRFLVDAAAGPGTPPPAPLSFLAHVA